MFLRALSLCAEAGIPPLHFQRLTLTAKFLTTTLQYPDLPVFQRLFSPSPRDKTHNLRYNLEKSLGRSFKFHCISPILPTVPPWLFSSLNINLSLTKLPKRSTPLFVYGSHFQAIIHSYRNPTICYTDGSKTKNRAGFAFSINNCTQAHRHRNTGM